MFKSKKIDTTLEKRILMGMIVSKRFMQEIDPLFDIVYFKDSYVVNVIRWLRAYWQEYNDVPEKGINALYDLYSNELDNETRKIIHDMLVDLSERYNNEQAINVDLLIDETLFLFKKRELEIIINNAQARLASDDINGAEEEILGMKKMSRLTSKWVNPLDTDEVQKHFDYKTEGFYSFDGVLGHFLGEMERGWLVGITAKYKSGKTWLLQEFGVQALLSGIPVAFFSLEMTENQMKERLYKRLTSIGSKEGQYMFPVFDCIHNQNGECNRKIRKNTIQLLDDMGEQPQYDPNNPYRVCVVCRGLPDSKAYEKAVWYESIHKEEYTFSNVGKTIAMVDKFHKNKWRSICYPRFSANSADITRDLDILKTTEGFVPGIILVDYVDILKAEHDGMTGVQKEDESWMAMARLAGEANALVVAPTQATGDALEAKTVTSKHTARWKGKLGHVDAMLAISQTDEEKVAGMQRISKMMHRHNEFSEEQTVTILQQLALGQGLLDSEW